MFSKKRFGASLLIIDWLIALLAWATFYYVRKVYIEETGFSIGTAFVPGLLMIPLFWLAIFALQGTYIDVRRLYRMKILSLTFFGTILGTIVLFFFILLDDEVDDHSLFYQSTIWLFSIHFSYFLIPRILFVSMLVKKIHKRKYGFRTLVIGGNEKAVEIVNELQQMPKSNGQFLIGFVNLNGTDKLLEGNLPYFGKADDKLETIIRQNNIEEVIIALESKEHDKIHQLIARMGGSDLKINILPDMYDILSGSVKISSIYGALLIEVNADIMPVWQRILKRFIDVVFSAIAIILLIPVYITIAILVKFSSPGPILFFQERIGKNGVPFKIIKFRTMYLDSEKAGPQLSSTTDKRITPIGSVLRKLRLDEFPQFFNVLKGDMSLVGPRPERQFFIDQIVATDPQFLQLTKVRPGITSWGQVKYGYAENVDQMLQRMKYDLLYMKNRTLALDFKILLYTVVTVIKAKGK
ncbi:MAG: sugar transferase [Crocinitomicaceae bacterium]|nr:sugar transferase [Crocinitomicaceae bacterium]